jgi:hypothetical protein
MAATALVAGAMTRHLSEEINLEQNYVQAHIAPIVPAVKSALSVLLTSGSSMRRHAVKNSHPLAVGLPGDLFEILFYFVPKSALT